MEKSKNSRIAETLNTLRNNGWQHMSILDNFRIDLQIPLMIKEQSDISFPKKVFENPEITSGEYGAYRNRTIYNLLNKFGTDLIWEFGAGDGDVCSYLNENDIAVIAVEPLSAGADEISKKGILTFNSSLADLELPANVCSNVGIFDVLEHIKEDVGFLNELNRVLTNDGLLFGTVPAHSWLFSVFDTELGHFRRYNKVTLNKALKESGFELLEIRYFMKLLIFPAIFLRKVSNLFRLHNSTSVDDELARKFKVVNSKYLMAVIKFFDKILPNFFGLSLIFVCKKTHS